MKGYLCRRTLGLGTALVAVVASMAVASPAFATPTGEYAVFAQCPLSNEALKGCIAAKTESGKFIVGNQEVPITNAITLQGGFTENEETEALTFVGAANGETLSKSPQKVPGGLLDLVKCPEITEEWGLRKDCEAIFENKYTGVNATTELAAAASSIGLNEANLLAEEGTALSLPVKVRLENELLGSECYIGSNSSPVVLNLTTGATSPPSPNKSIHGSKGVEEVNSEGTILTLAKNSLVNNSFAAPGASGCGGGFSWLLDPIIDAKLGLPAAAGHNTAILDGTLKQAGARRVREH
jgi:hypothetical protein